ncbi:MAG TPA: helix-turn-helix domain-containing protein [Acidimicrobiales bacterium]|jgi:excisionase family DNA binding protein
MTAIETEHATVGLPEAADRLGVHRATVNDMVRSGRLPAHREGAHWRIDRKALEQFASTYVKPPNAPARRPRGLPTSAPALLKLLEEFGSASAAELAPLLDLHEGNVRKHLRLLEHSGQVRRRPDGEWEVSMSG